MDEWLTLKIDGERCGVCIPKHESRNIQIYRRRNTGEKLRSIGYSFELSAESIRRIHAKLVRAKVYRARIGLEDPPII